MFDISNILMEVPIITDIFIFIDTMVFNFSIFVCPFGLSFLSPISFSLHMKSPRAEKTRDQKFLKMNLSSFVHVDDIFCRG